MQRVIVIGSGGAGKSTLAVRLGAVLQLPVIHLDREYWQPGWVELPKIEWAARMAELCAQPRWVMGGNYGGTMEDRLGACDTVVFLDLLRWVCLLRVLRRNLRHLDRARPDMNAGCPERLPNAAFLRWILDYPATRRPKILATLDGLKGRKKVIVLSSQCAIEAFFATAGLAPAAPVVSASAVDQPATRPVA